MINYWSMIELKAPSADARTDAAAYKIYYASIAVWQVVSSALYVLHTYYNSVGKWSSPIVTVVTIWLVYLVSFTCLM